MALGIPGTNQQEAAAVVAELRSGDEAAFAALAEPYRRQLHVHCYRMLGSFDDAEDLVQETLLRAWRGRAGFEGRSTVRTWLYRIATNACLDFLESKAHRLQSLAGPGGEEPNAVDSLYVVNKDSSFHTFDITVDGQHYSYPLAAKSTTGVVLKLGTGKYTYWCAVGNHRQNGMEGTIQTS